MLKTVMLIIVYRSTLQKKGMPGKDEIPCHG
jgi:hypothetical protein